MCARDSDRSPLTPLRPLSETSPHPSPLKLGLLGGSFNPIHNGHLTIARLVHNRLRLDQMLFIPTGDPPHKRDGSLAPAKDRYEMVRLALTGTPFFQLSDIEIRRTGKSYSIDTIRELQRQFGSSAELYFLIGLDAFRLLFGTAPADFAGATEGALLGWGVGLGAMLAASQIASQSARRAIVLAGAIGAAMGLAITALGGRIMGGSLAALASEFPQSRLQLGSIGSLVGEAGFGPISLATTAALEGALFSACVVGALAIAARRSSGP